MQNVVTVWLLQNIILSTPKTKGDQKKLKIPVTLEEHMNIMICSCKTSENAKKVAKLAKIWYHLAPHEYNIV